MSVILDLLAGAQAWASEAAAEHHAPSINEIWFPLGNFLIFAFLIGRYAVPAARRFLQSRRAEVLAVLAESSAKKAQAETLLRDYQGRLAGLDKEIAALQRSLREDGEKEKSKLLSEAQGLVARIQEDADFLAAQETKMARQKMREEMAMQAEAAARELIQRNLSPADQGRLVTDFVRSIEQTR
jgi:F-type H+-transporting ATPase subunit b